MTLRLNGASSGFTEIKAADAAGDNSIKLPATNGGANQLLQNGGTAGELQYTSAEGGLHYSGGRLLLGTPTARSTGVGFTSFLQVESAQTVSGCSLSLVGNRDISDLGPRLNFGRSKGGALGSNTAVDDNAELGGIYFWGADGTDTNSLGASIVAAVDGDPAANSMPTRLEFSTTSSGDASPTPRVQLRPTGEIALLQDCPGIDFSRIQPAADDGTMDSETLDSYEEGRFTPVLKFGGNNVGMDTDHAEGAYTKIGRVVHCFMRFRLSDKGTSTGDAEFHDLPFTVGNILTTTAVQGGAEFAFVSGVNAHTSFQAHPWEETNTLGIYRKTTSSGSPGEATEGFFSNSFDCRLTFSYMVA